MTKRLITEMRAHPHGRTSIIFLIVFGLIIGFIITVLIPWPGFGQPAPAPAPAPAHSQMMCSPQPPDYPGCSVAQIRSVEAPNRDETFTKYVHDRWDHTSGLSLTINQNTVMRNAYNRAVTQAVSQALALHPHARMSRAAMMDTFLDWPDFRAQTACTLGYFNAVYSGWCHVSDREDQFFADAVDKGVTVSLSCAGTMVTAAVGGGIGDRLLMGSTTPYRVGVLGLAAQGGCIAGKMFNSIWPF